VWVYVCGECVCARARARARAFCAYVHVYVCLSRSLSVSFSPLCPQGGVATLCSDFPWTAKARAKTLNYYFYFYFYFSLESESKIKVIEMVHHTVPNVFSCAECVLLIEFVRFLLIECVLLKALRWYVLMCVVACSLPPPSFSPLLPFSVRFPFPSPSLFAPVRASMYCTRTRGHTHSSTHTRTHSTHKSTHTHPRGRGHTHIHTGGHGQVASDKQH
jgi:hypothetical protein